MFNHPAASKSVSGTRCNNPAAPVGVSEQSELLLLVCRGCIWCHMGQQNIQHGIVHPNILYNTVLVQTHSLDVLHWCLLPCLVLSAVRTVGVPVWYMQRPLVCTTPLLLDAIYLTPLNAFPERAPAPASLCWLCLVAAMLGLCAHDLWVL